MPKKKPKHDAVIILCERVADLKRPVEGSRQTPCDKCGETCWLSRATEAEAKAASMPIQVRCRRYCVTHAELNDSDFAQIGPGQQQEIVRELLRRQLENGGDEVQH